ncbi:hypothetical protein TNIN_293371 [Trichonephila inaurata madagascariensis]|uniref:Uncharacterized protein n=1 Tax=Trichonephila inaurata madagascariensis TaxID=2747483 RepID=A0A8X7C757_9ARAC|nr:hypothetical protein TNIN_293371 [Trichonephila inaurata madagascariensis]
MKLYWLILYFATSSLVTGEKIGCEPTEFRCSSGQCVDGGRYCDGNSDCFDGTDEPERCTNGESLCIAPSLKGGMIPMGRFDSQAEERLRSNFSPNLAVDSRF